MAERAKLFDPMLDCDVLIIWYWPGKWPPLLLLSMPKSVCVRWALFGRGFALRDPCPITRDVFVGLVGITTS